MPRVRNSDRTSGIAGSQRYRDDTLAVLQCAPSESIELENGNIIELMSGNLTISDALINNAVIVNS